MTDKLEINRYVKLAITAIEDAQIECEDNLGDIPPSFEPIANKLNQALDLLENVTEELFPDPED